MRQERNYIQLMANFSAVAHYIHRSLTTRGTDPSSPSYMNILVHRLRHRHRHMDLSIGLFLIQLRQFMSTALRLRVKDVLVFVTYFMQIDFNAGIFQLSACDCSREKKTDGQLDEL